MIVTKRGIEVFSNKGNRIKLDQTGKNTWKRCRIIAKEIKKELEQTFPGVIGGLYAQEFVDFGKKMYGVYFNDYNGLSVSVTIQYLDYDKEKPFVYLDSIKVSEECRGMGLSTKFLDCIKRLVDRKVFNYLNFKDWSAGYWEHVQPRYPFLRNKYTNGFRLG